MTAEPNFPSHEEQQMSKQSQQAKDLADHYVDQLSGWGKVTTRPLFGAVALYASRENALLRPYL